MKNVILFTIDQGNLIWWWDNQLFSVKSRQEFFWSTDSVNRIFLLEHYDERIQSFTDLTEWVNFPWMQDSYVLLRLDSISWLKAMENNFMERLVANTLIQDVTDHLNLKNGSWEGSTKYWTRIGNYERRILYSGKRQKQNRKEENLLVVHRVSFRWKQGIGLILNQGITLSLRTKIRRKWSIFFDILRKYNEKMTERLNSGEFLKKIFRVSLHKFFVGRTINGKYVWQQEEEQKEKTVLHWWFRNNHFFPSSSRTFRTQSYWSSMARQCCDSEQILPYLPHWMCV